MHLRHFTAPWMLVLSLCVGPANAAAGPEPKAAVIAEAGKPHMSIVVGERCSRPVRFAAEELQQTIRRISGADCPILTDNAQPATPVIAVGPPAENAATSRLLEQAGVEFPALNLGEEGFLLRTVGSNLVVAGGTAPRATLYGAYALLERLGCRWCFPAQQGYVIPDLPTLPLPELDQVERPAFPFRTFSHTVAVSTDTIERIDWMAKNRLNRFLVTLYPIKGFQGQWYSDFKKVPGLLEAIEKRGLQIHAGHHASYFWTSPQEFYDTHPEFFAQIDGERFRGTLDGRRAQLCWSSNPQLATITADRIVAFSQENPEADIFSIWPDDDDNGYCQCSSCETQGSMSNAYVTFVNRVAEQVYRQNPRIQVSMLAYNKVSDPPTIPVFGKNTLCVVVGDEADVDRLRGWVAAGPKDVALYQLYMGSYSDRSLPGIWPHKIATTLKAIHELGLRGVTSQGEIYNFGAYALNYWTYARLIWNPTLDVDDVLRDYLQHYYGEAAEPMQAYFALLETLGRRSWGEVDIPAESLSELDRLLHAAEQAGTSEAVRERLSRDRICLDYLRLAWEIGQSQNRLTELQQQGSLAEVVRQMERSVHMCESCLYHLEQYRGERAFLSGRQDKPEEVIGYRYTRRPYEEALAKSRSSLVMLDRENRLPRSRRNLALYRPVTAQSVYRKQTAEQAVNGHAGDGWAAGYSPVHPSHPEDKLPQWLQVDLGGLYPLGAVVIKTPAKVYGYFIEVSPDAQTWRKVADKTDSAPGDPQAGQVHVFPQVEARYVRATVTAASDQIAYLYEVEVYEQCPSTDGESAQAGEKPGAPVSGLDDYAQGGVVVDGVAYFTANDSHRTLGVGKPADFPCVVAFDALSLRKLRTYPFAKTYDSSPLVVQNQAGRTLVLAHEYQEARTVACDRDTGDVVWRSAANQPGALFFGYSYYARPDGSKLILMACANGLHAMSSETGEDVWYVPEHGSGGVTPCVDQARGWIYYQCSGKMFKIAAADGRVLTTAAVPRPNACVSWNTVLVNDAHGYFVATYWYGNPEWDSAVRVYDGDLKLVWERTSLPAGTKSTLTYGDGKLVVGSGNMWYAKYTGDSWKYIAAYAIADGQKAWQCDLSQFNYTCILNVPYYNGSFYAEMQNMPHLPSHLFRIRASDGQLTDVLDYGRALTSCAPCIIACGRVMSGDMWQDRVVVTQVSSQSRADWPGPFGDPQTNQNAALPDPGAQDVPLRELRFPIVNDVSRQQNR